MKIRPPKDKPESAADPAGLLEKAIDHLRNQRPAQAEPLLQEILRGAPEQPDALQFLGVLRHQQGRSEEGAALIRQCLAQRPADVGAWNNLGNVLLSSGHASEAALAYESGLRAAPESEATASVYSNLAAIYRQQDRLAESEAACRRALALAPEFPEAWYSLSITLLRLGRIHDGLVANSRAIVLWPRNLMGRQQFIRALLLLGENKRAARMYREWLKEEPHNVVVKHQLAACLGQAVPERASDEYVTELFDAFAESFDAKLGALNYRAPELVTQAFAAAAGPAPAAGLARMHIVDVGCGTGLCGPLLRPWAQHLAGCDLSKGMLKRAAPRRCYDVLHAAELVFYLDTQPAHFDAVISADTLCYFGDLTAAMQAAHKALRSGGLLVFTVEALPAGESPEAHRLQVNGRYAHSRQHIEASLQQAGLTLTALSSETLRMEAGEPVVGWLVTARRG